VFFPLFTESVTSSWKGRRLAGCLGKSPSGCSWSSACLAMTGNGFQTDFLKNGPRGRGEADQPMPFTLIFFKAGTIFIFPLLHNLLSGSLSKQAVILWPLCCFCSICHLKLNILLALCDLHNTSW